MGDILGQKVTETDGVVGGGVGDDAQVPAQMNYVTTVPQLRQGCRRRPDTIVHPQLLPARQ